ncbi:MAG: hypothetical protein ACTHNH_14505 [Mesorhizobium sp.]
MKKLLISAFALTMMTGSALAAGGTTSALDNKDMMAPFYTDSNMKTMKSDDEFKAAWMAMKQEDRDMITKECSTDTEKLHNDFCEKTKKLGGAN